MASAQKTSKTYQLSLARRVGYGIGDFGINMFSTVVGSFLTAYYTDSVLLGAIFVGNTYTASILLFFGGNQQGYFGMSILYTAMTAICLIITCVSSKEYLVENREQEKARMQAAGIQQQSGGLQAILTALFSNHYVLPMAVAFAFNWLALSINGGGQVYYCRDVLGSMRFMGTLSMARPIPAILILLVGVGLDSAVLGYVLDWGGYEAANIPISMPPETILAEKIAYIVVPGICLAVVLLIGFLIDVDKKLPELRAQKG